MSPHVDKQRPRRPAGGPPAPAWNDEAHPQARWIARAMSHRELTPLDPQDLAALEAICSAREVPAGTRLVARGSRVDRVLVLREGEAKMTASTPSGPTVMIVVRRGGVIADIPMLLGTPAPFEVVASRPSEVIEVDRAGLLELLAASPGLSLRWMTSIAARLDADRRRLLTVMTKPLASQVAFLLLEQMEPDDDGNPIVTLSHAVIAQLLGARRQSVTRVIRELREAGLVSTGYRSTRLLDLDGLQDLAGEVPVE